MREFNTIILSESALEGLKMAKQTKITKSARGEDCSLQIHPYCNMNPETTVLAHINSDDSGMGLKSNDTS